MEWERARRLLRWDSNPFSFNILPQYFVGHEKESNAILQGMQNGDKFSLLLGPTGSGKTTLIKYVAEKVGRDRLVYLPKPPRDAEDWIKILSQVLDTQDITLYNLSERINETLGEKRLFLFVDECQEASIESLEWLRTIVDQCNGLSVLMAGPHEFEERLSTDLESLLKRVTISVRLGRLTKYEAREMIKRRVEGFGGDDIKPFTSDIVDYIYQKSDGVPREILRVSSELAGKILEKNISVADRSFLEEVESLDRELAKEGMEMLSDRQRELIGLLTERGPLTPPQIVELMKIDAYKTKGNALRGVNNILRRLVLDRHVERRRMGKTYKYAITDTLPSL